MIPCYVCRRPPPHPPGPCRDAQLSRAIAQDRALRRLARNGPFTRDDARDLLGPQAATNAIQRLLRDREIVGRPDGTFRRTE